MTGDPRDPAYDDRRYCDRCLSLLSEDWMLEQSATEWPVCPTCHRGIDRVLTSDEARTEHAIRRADYEINRAKDERAMGRAT